MFGNLILILISREKEQIAKKFDLNFNEGLTVATEKSSSSTNALNAHSYVNLLYKKMINNHCTWILKIKVCFLHFFINNLKIISSA